MSGLSVWQLYMLICRVKDLKAMFLFTRFIPLHERESVIRVIKQRNSQLTYWHNYSNDALFLVFE